MRLFHQRNSDGFQKVIIFNIQLEEIVRWEINIGIIAVYIVDA